MTISKDFWENIQITDKDLEDIYSFLLETESPLDKFEITKLLIQQKISEQENILLIEASEAGDHYLPEKTYSENDVLVFPAKDSSKGRVVSVRKGINPDYPDLQVIEVEMITGVHVSFASNLKAHKLNNPLPAEKNYLLDSTHIYNEFGHVISEKVSLALENNPDLVCIARQYFPRALLFDIGIGPLNLCEAVLEMAGGGPFSTTELMTQIDLPISNNSKLTEFSLNFALEEDGRFDEVGPAGITLWFLKRLEPKEVQNPPFTLEFSGHIPETPESIHGLNELNRMVDDELEQIIPDLRSDEMTISLSYPHWRAGTLPLTDRNKDIFPTAYETPRVKFEFNDTSSHTKFSGWVVRPNKYIYGLKDWYTQQGVIPGSFVTVKKSPTPGEVIVQTAKNKNSRDWIRTVLIGADGGIVFALLKQVISCTYDERMAIMIPDVSSLDQIWASNKFKQPIEKVILIIMREIGKLNLQNQIHAQELYSAVNIIRRTPPSVILSVLHSQPWATHLGDLYFKLEENAAP